MVIGGPAALGAAGAAGETAAGGEVGAVAAWTGAGGAVAGAEATARAGGPWRTTDTVLVRPLRSSALSSRVCAPLNPSAEKVKANLPSRSRATVPECAGWPTRRQDRDSTSAGVPETSAGSPAWPVTDMTEPNVDLFAGASMRSAGPPARSRSLSAETDVWPLRSVPRTLRATGPCSPTVENEKSNAPSWPNGSGPPRAVPSTDQEREATSPSGSSSSTGPRTWPITRTEEPYVAARPGELM